MALLWESPSWTFLQTCHYFQLHIPYCTACRARFQGLGCAGLGCTWKKCRKNDSYARQEGDGAVTCPVGSWRVGCSCYCFRSPKRYRSCPQAPADNIASRQPVRWPASAFPAEQSAERTTCVEERSCWKKAISPQLNEHTKRLELKLKTRLEFLVCSSHLERLRRASLLRPELDDRDRERGRLQAALRATRREAERERDRDREGDRLSLERCENLESSETKNIRLEL